MMGKSIIAGVNLGIFICLDKNLDAPCHNLPNLPSSRCSLRNGHQKIPPLQS